MIKNKNGINRKDQERSKPGKRGLTIHEEIAQAALELSDKNEKITGKDPDNWLEEDRIVEKWQKDKSGR